MKEVYMRVKKSPIRKAVGPGDFIGKFYKTVRKLILPIAQTHPNSKRIISRNIAHSIL